MRALLAIAILSSSGCATFDRSEYATLLFEQPPIMGSPGGILGIGEVTDFGGVPSMLVRPGKRTVYYRCPGTIAMDEQPNLRSSFEAGATYVLECDGTTASVHLRSSPGNSSRGTPRRGAP